jgi:signal transduction histidine kinase
MRAVGRTLTAAATYRRLLFLLSGLPLGVAWFAVLVAGWSVCAGLAITPLVIPLLIGLALATRALAAVEAAVAERLLGVAVNATPVRPPGGAFWARFRALLGPAFWRAQAYLLIRALAGFSLAVALLGLLAGALALLFAPAWLPFVHEGAQLGIWRPHTFIQSLALVPLGLFLLPAVILTGSWVAGAFRPLVVALLADRRGADGETPAGRDPSVGRPAGDRRRPASRPGRALAAHAAVETGIVAVLVLIWALTSRGYVWPVWAALPFALALAIHGWFVLLGARPALVRRLGGSRALAGTVGVALAGVLFLVAIWAITGHGYFWPQWPMLAAAIIVGVYAATVLLASPAQAELSERIDTLESTRAGAVDVQDSELRRIERDLHDGAQARLVALGMSLGMAEQKLAQDPERAGELLAEARVDAEAALRELRDLARGIHPPVLADRGLEAAVGALANTSAVRVTLSATVAERPSSAVESAAYFVVAEALANASKHAGAERLDIRIARIGERLVVEIEDDGSGNADPGGAGLVGLRHRVEALDGSLRVTSPPGGPTIVRAELPCVW